MKYFILIALCFTCHAARAELPVDDAVYSDSDGALVAEEGDDGQLILVKQYVGPGSSYSNSDGVSWENGVCQRGCHQGDYSDDNNSSSQRKKKRN